MIKLKVVLDTCIIVATREEKWFHIGTIINHNCVNEFQESVWAMIFTLITLNQTYVIELSRLISS